MNLPETPQINVPQIPILQSFMENFENLGGLRISFDDLTGALTGFHLDVEEMKVDWAHQVHCSSFCSYAGKDPSSSMDCVRNKLATNRLVSRRRQGLEGTCHLGLFDMAEPLIVREKVLGVFYYGSVVIKGMEDEARQKIRRYCERKGLDAKGYLAELDEATVLDPQTLPQHRAALQSIVRLAHFFCEAAVVRPEIYRYRELKFPYVDPKQLPYLVKATIHYIGSHAHEPFNIKEVASHLKCHPDYLSRKFKQDTGMDLSAYIQQARVDRAKRLLTNPKMDLSMAADQSGFSDNVHFTKVFRRVTGVTPGQYQRGERAQKV